jgi:SAM-dependent methyltransferase
VLTVDYARLGLRPGERILDLGCGGGRHAFESFRRGARVVALDADAGEVAGVAGMLAMMADAGEAGEEASGGVVRGDALALPFRDGSFDRVIAAEVLEHIPDDRAAMRELARVVRPGGVLAVTVPRFGPELINWLLSDDYHGRPGGHVRIYRRGELVARVRSAGLRPTGGHHAHGLHSPYWWLRCLVGVDRDRHPLVRAYHSVLVWDIVKRPLLTRAASRLLDPLIGKSVVVYFEKPPAAGTVAVATPAPAGSVHGRAA